MPALTEVEEYAGREKLPEWEVDDESATEYYGYTVNVGDKADSSEGAADCNVLTALSQSTPCDLTTSTQPNRDDGKGGNCEVVVEKKNKILNDVSEDIQLSEGTSEGVNSCKDQQIKQNGENRNKEEMEDDDDVDGGWGYMVLLGTFTIMTVVAVLGPGFGILFADYLTQRKASTTITTAIFNSESFAWSVSNLLAGPLTEQFGWRRVGMIGGLLCCLGMTASAYAPSPAFLFFSHSVLLGFGSGSSCLVAFAVIPRYFKRQLGRANGFTTAGMCVGGMIGPPLVTYLQEQFGFRGATLIVAAFALHICLAAAMFRPKQELSKVKETTTTRPGACQLMYQVACSLGRNCMLLKSPRVAIISIGSCFVVGIYLNLFLLVPFVMEAKNHTQETAAWCMSISNLTNLATRLIISSFADTAWFSVLGCYLAFATLLSLSTIAFSFAQEVIWLTVVLAVWGCGIGATMSLFPIIIVRYMGVNKYVAVLGVSGVTQGVWMLCCGPTIGIIRDWSGSYNVSLCVLGASGFLTVMLFFLLPSAVAYDKRKEQHQRAKDAEVGG